jgi:beta-phosphoglucomutase-like phosphatase (HAD superfamily)
MRAGETELQMCVRHVAEQEDRIARQDILVERLRQSRSALLDEALQLLTEMRSFLDAMHDHVARFSTTSSSRVRAPKGRAPARSLA